MANIRKMIGQAVMVKYFRDNSPLRSDSFSLPKPTLLEMSGLLLFLGAGFMIYAAFLHFDRLYTSDTAWFYTGCLVILFSIILTSIAVSIGLYKRYRLLKFKDEVEEVIMDFVEKFDGDFHEHIQKNPKTTVLAASVIGYILADRFL